MAATVAVGLTTTLAATPAHAVEPIVDGPIGLHALTAFAVDGTHDYLLMASGSAPNGVTITNLSGDVLDKLITYASIDDVTLTPGDHYAFAASSALQKIYEIDLTQSTPTLVHTFSVNASDCPESVAAVSPTLVAFGYACNAGYGGVAVLNATTSAIVYGSNTELVDPFVRALPGTTKYVATAQNGVAVTAVFDAALMGNPAPLRDTTTLPSGGLSECDGVQDLSVSPDSSTIVVACEGDDMQREYSLTDFSPMGGYPTNAYTTATAVSPNGGYVAAGMNGIYDDDVAMFTRPAASLVYSLDYSDDETAGPTTPAHGLAFSADGTQLYALAIDDTVSPDDLYLVTLPVTSAPTFPPVSPPVAPPVAPPIAPPVAPPIGPVSSPVVQQAAQISVLAPPRTTIGVPYAVTGTMHYANGLPAVGSTVTITTDVAGVAVSGTTTVSATGTFTDPVDPKKLGWTTITASSAAAPAHYAVSASTNTTVVKGAAKVTVKVAKLHGKVYVVTARLTSFGVNRHVLISAGKKVIANVVANKSGLVSVKFTRKTKTVFTVVFTGDANDYPARASVTLH